MDGGLLAMSALERERSHIVRALSKGLILQREAAERLGLGVRQVKRLLRAFRENGDAGLISRQRGRVSPRRMDGAKRARIEALLRGKYPDFGATLAAEKLSEREGIEVSRETVRRIQIALGLARARRRRSAN
jgi:transposase